MPSAAIHMAARRTFKRHNSGNEVRGAHAGAPPHTCAPHTCAPHTWCGGRTCVRSCMSGRNRSTVSNTSPEPCQMRWKPSQREVTRQSPTDAVVAFSLDTSVPAPCAQALALISAICLWREHELTAFLHTGTSFLPACAASNRDDTICTRQSPAAAVVALSLDQGVPDPCVTMICQHDFLHLVDTVRCEAANRCA